MFIANEFGPQVERTARFLHAIVPNALLVLLENRIFYNGNWTCFIRGGVMHDILFIFNPPIRLLVSLSGSILCKLTVSNLNLVVDDFLAILKLKFLHA